jgi:hypothetical protein
MNTVGAAATIACAYMYISLYLYIIIYCTYTVYIYYVCISVTSAFGMITKSTRQLRIISSLILTYSTTRADAI